MIGLCVTNLLATATLGGGSYEVAAGRDYMKTRDVAYSARTTDDANASTRFTVDHGAAVTRRVLSLRCHNCSPDAEIRWSVGTSSGGNEVTTTGVVDAWRFSPRAFDGRDHDVTIVLPSDAVGRYDYVELFDTTNPDGYIEIGQAWLGSIDFLPTFGPVKGLKHTLRSLSGKERSPGGALWTNQQRSIRGVQFALNVLDPAADGAALHEIERYLGTTEQMLYLPSLVDHAEIQRHGFIGTFDELSALDYPRFNNNAMPISGTQD